MQDNVYEVESFLQQNFEFRRNVLRNMVEYREIGENGSSPAWEAVTTEVLNTIVRSAKREGIGGKRSPRTDIDEYIHSKAVKSFQDIQRSCLYLFPFLL